VRSKNVSNNSIMAKQYVHTASENFSSMAFPLC
jgi:hypothetical protein